jgi:hypothetical protein
MSKDKSKELKCLACKHKSKDGPYCAHKDNAFKGKQVTARRGEDSPDWCPLRFK